MGFSPFEVVYGSNLCTSLNLTPIAFTIMCTWEAEKRVNEIQELHASVRGRIEKFNEQNKMQANKHRTDI